MGNAFEEDFLLSDKNIEDVLNIKLNRKCSINDKCFGGCYAAKIMSGKYIDDCDTELCPLNDE